MDFILVKNLCSGDAVLNLQLCPSKSRLSSDKSMHTNNTEVGKELKIRIAWLTTLNFINTKRYR